MNVRSLRYFALILKKPRYNIQVCEILRSSELLRSVDRALVSDVSGQTVQSSRVQHTIPHIDSHKSNASSVPLYIVVLYSALHWVTWKAVTVVEGIPCWEVTTTRWLMGLCSTQAKVEGIVSKAAWHWGRDSSVVTILLGNHPAPHCTQVFCLRGAPQKVTLRFSCMYVGGLLFEDSGRHT